MKPILKLCIGLGMLTLVIGVGSLLVLLTFFIANNPIILIFAMLFILISMIYKLGDAIYEDFF